MVGWGMFAVCASRFSSPMVQRRCRRSDFLNSFWRSGSISGGCLSAKILSSFCQIICVELSSAIPDCQLPEVRQGHRCEGVGSITNLPVFGLRMFIICWWRLAVVMVLVMSIHVWPRQVMRSKGEASMISCGQFCCVMKLWWRSFTVRFSGDWLILSRHCWRASGSLSRPIVCRSSAASGRRVRPAPQPRSSSLGV